MEEVLDGLDGFFSYTLMLAVVVKYGLRIGGGVAHRRRRRNWGRGFTDGKVSEMIVNLSFLLFFPHAYVYFSMS